MGNSESNESAAVKRQAEGGTNPMYTLLDLSGISYWVEGVDSDQEPLVGDRALLNNVTAYFAKTVNF